MTNATVGTTIDDAAHVSDVGGLGSLESALCDILGFLIDTDITASPFSLDNAGRITKQLVLQRAASPVGWRFRDSTGGNEMRIAINGANLDFDQNTGSEAVPTWVNRFRIALADGKLTGTSFSSARQGLVPTGSGVATEFLNGTAAWSTPSAVSVPGCRVRHSVNQSLTSGSFTALAFDTEDYDTDTMHSTVTNNSRITFTTAGKYRIVGQAVWDSNANGFRELTIRHNGSLDIAIERILSPGVLSHAQVVETVYNVAASDYVQLYGRQSSGSALNVASASAYSPVFSAYKVG